MKNLNQYATYYKRRPTEELKEIAFRKEMYHDDARLAALLELQDRNEEISDEQSNELETLSIKAKEIAEEKAKVNTWISEESEVLPEWYSPGAILGFSMFFSVIFGGVMMYSNLWKIGKKTEAIRVVLISLGIMFFSAFVSHTYKMNQLIVLLINLSGALILIEYFWKKHLGYNTKFKRKPLTKAILISVGITFFMLVVLFYFFKDQLPKI